MSLKSLVVSARRTEKLSKDGDRGLHFQITQKLINWVGAVVGIVIDIHHSSVIQKACGDAAYILRFIIKIIILEIT